MGTGADAAMDFTLHLWSELHAAHIRVRKEVSSPARKSPLKPKPSSSTGLTKEKKKTPTRVASEEKEGSSLMAKFDSVEDEVFHVGLRDTFGVAGYSSVTNVSRSGIVTNVSRRWCKRFF